jgi:hypothetical protein
MPWSFSDGAVAEKYMPQLQPQFVAWPGRSRWLRLLLLLSLAWPGPQPSAIFFIDEFDAHGRIFNWETVHPTAVFRSLIAEEAAPFLGLAANLIRRFLPDADQRTVTIAAVWLLGQCSVFLRNREQLAEPPVGLVLDEPAVEWLSTTISHQAGRPCHYSMIWALNLNR